MQKKLATYAVLTLVLLAVFQVYLVTAYPVFRNDDSPETTTVSYTLGIAHPPGYPLFTLAGKIFTLIPVASQGFRMNIFAGFLSILVLLVTYFILIKNLQMIFEQKNTAFCLGGMLALAFSYIFWNLGTGAKGGIYIFNLLFLSLCTYYVFRLFNKFGHKYIYMIFYIYGLSLSHHWPNSIVLAPVFLYFVYRHREKMKTGNWLLTAAFFAAGLTPYIYLPIRAMGNTAFKMGYPVGVKNFLGFIALLDYHALKEAAPDRYFFQMKAAVLFLIKNYSAFVILALPGTYIIYKKSKKTFYYYTAVFLFTVVSVVVLFNKANRLLIWMIDNYLMPAAYIILFFIVTGAVFTMNKIQTEKKKIKYASAAVMILLLAFMAAVNFRKNDGSRDYVLYDYGHNILKTMEPGSFYLPEGDYNSMPLYYIRNIEHDGMDIGFEPIGFFAYPWAVRDFALKYGGISLICGDFRYCVKSIIDNFIDKSSIYRTAYFDLVPNNNGFYPETQKGVLLKMVKYFEKISTAIYDEYSYRGIYRESVRDIMNLNIMSEYINAMFGQGNICLSSGNPDGAISLYRKALLFYNGRPQSLIYYQLALAYQDKGDQRNKMICLEKIKETDPDFWKKYESSGLIYYNK